VTSIHVATAAGVRITNAQMDPAIDFVRLVKPGTDVLVCRDSLTLREASDCILDLIDVSIVPFTMIVG
jgi:intracellular sulfur oxidation DsrE/DsrF family protein